MGEQRVDQGAVGVARRRVDDHAGRLDQDDQVLVLEQDLELRGLGLRARAARPWHVENEALARFDPAAGLVYQPFALVQVAFAHQGLQARARELRQPAGQEQVEPPPSSSASAASSIGPKTASPVAPMSESLLRAVKVFAVVAGLLIVGGTATLIWLLVKRSGDSAGALPTIATAEPATIALPPGGEITQVTSAGGQLLLLGRSPAEGQFVLMIDLASGERRRLLRLVPAQP